MIFLFKSQLRTAECTWKGQNPNRCKALMFEKQGDPDMSCLLTFLAPHHHSIIFKHLFKCMVLFCVVSKGQMTYYYYFFYQYNWILLRNNSMIIFFFMQGHSILKKEIPKEACLSCISIHIVGRRLESILPLLYRVSII